MKSPLLWSEVPPECQRAAIRMAEEEAKGWAEMGDRSWDRGKKERGASEHEHARRFREFLRRAKEESP